MQDLTTTQKNQLSAAARTLDYTGGFGQLIQDLIDIINAGNIGVTADAWDVDAAAKNSGLFAQDADNTTGLTFAYRASRFNNGLAIITVAAGTLALSASTTNYVEVDSAGTVSSNTSGFTATSMPLYQIATGVSTITTVTNKKSLMTLLTALTGAKLTTTAKTKSIEIPLGTLSATGTFLFVAPHACTVTAMSLASATAVAGDNTNYWTFAAINKTSSGSGTTAVLAATDPNTTKATGGTSISAYIVRDLTLHGTSGNLDLAAGDVVVFTATKTSSADPLTNAVLRVNYKSEN